ncbi:hypothetical protein KM1_125210 [Entamoeba histolytica HM-3:IMSS]|uniref:Uncharacterized protein n=1 Tax=Entamoeba histolytica HM-3:IMSS TaxID=885315 RepID=M7W8S2_ENTHI|nr:hypothetical protein KM1_125210 [Entamoeba histolytica HM-3:IMSS]
MNINVSIISFNN